MHPEDEAEFIAEILLDPEVVFINGPRWQSECPETHRNINEIDSYCIIWSPKDIPVLTAKYIETCYDWYCNSEFATIQFLRSSLFSDRILIEGSIAICTTEKGEKNSNEAFAKPVEKRYKTLRRFLKKTYFNSVISWENTKAPKSPATSVRSANPSKPDASVWIGPKALKWLQADMSRCVKQFPQGFVEGNFINTQEG